MLFMFERYLEQYEAYVVLFARGTFDEMDSPPENLTVRSEQLGSFVTQ